MNLIEIMEAIQGHDKKFVTSWLREMEVPPIVTAWILRSFHRGRFIGLPKTGYPYQGGHGDANYQITWKEKRKRKK
jgi:hypothetical protein